MDKAEKKRLASEKKTAEKAAKAAAKEAKKVTQQALPPFLFKGCKECVPTSTEDLLQFPIVVLQPFHLGCMVPD